MKHPDTSLFNVVWRSALMVLALLALQGCGGGGGSSTPAVTNADPTGYYDTSGTATVEDNSGGTVNITDMEAMASNNHIIMISGQIGFQYDISITSVNGNNFTGNVTVFYTPGASQFKRTTTVSGTITQGSSITGTIAGPGLGGGSFSLVYGNLAYHLTSSTYSFGTRFGGSTGYYIIQIASEKNITTSKTVADGLYTSCLMNGTATYIGSGNLYSVSISISGCADNTIDGNYTGFMAPQNAIAAQLAFAITKSDSSYGFGTDLSQ